MQWGKNLRCKMVSKLHRAQGFGIDKLNTKFEQLKVSNATLEVAGLASESCPKKRSYSAPLFYPILFLFF